MTKSIFSILAAIIALAIFFFYTKPSYDTVQALSAQNAQYDAALSKATQLQQLKQTLLSKYNSFDPNQLARLQTLLPDQVDNIRLILDLDNIAGADGMSLQGVQVSTPASQAQNTSAIGAIASAEQPFDSVTLQFTTHGSYAQFKQFLSDLQSSLRLVDVVSISIAPQGSASGSSSSSNTNATSTASSYIYSYNMTLQTYWLP